MEPWKPVLKAKIPPSEATGQASPLAPEPLTAVEMPTTGRWRCSDPVDPKNCASPKLKMPPSVPTALAGKEVPARRQPLRDTGRRGNQGDYDGNRDLTDPTSADGESVIHDPANLIAISSPNTPTCQAP